MTSQKKWKLTCLRRGETPRRKKNKKRGQGDLGTLRVIQSKLAEIEVQDKKRMVM